MRTLLPLAFLLFSAPAHAFGLGTSITFSDYGYWTYAPTLDLIFEPVTVQIHLVETLDEAFEDDLYLGANVQVRVVEKELTKGLWGVAEPGGAMWINGDPTRVSLAANMRVGAEAGQDVRAGLFVVPYLGLQIEDGDADVFAAGGLQFAVSFAL
jgi:hypothetical protein